MSPIVGLVKKMLNPIQRRVRIMIARGLIELVDESKTAQILQVSLQADQLRDDVERFQEYGFSSYPEAGAEALVLMVGGNSDHGVVVATEDRRYRPTDLTEGEVALYTKQNAKRVHLKADGTVLIGTTPTDFVALATPTKSEIDALRSTVNALVTKFNSHTHQITAQPTTCPAGAGTCTGVTVGPPSAASAPAAVGEVKATEVKAK